MLRDARTKAGLSQRELARRANTAQSVVARIEGGQTSPSWDTLNGLLAAAGFGVETRLAEPAVEVGQALDDTPRILALSPEDRLHELRNADRFLASIRRA
jgi:transcriptional regulator with XRE-family HTH domain